MRFPPWPRRWRPTDPAGERAAALAAGGAATVALTALAVFVDARLAVAVLAAAVATPFVLRSVELAFAAVVGVVTLLPFAAIPLGVGFNPTFLDLTLGVLYLIWVVRLATREATSIRIPPLGIGAMAFIGLMLLAFAAGLAHGTPTKNQIRTFGELVLGAGLFFIVANLVVDRASLRRLFALLVALGAAAAALGLALYVLPDALEARLLGLLRVVDYPSGPGVIRYINDDPARLQRATGTAIDPNSFGGLLAVLGALAAPQIVSRRPILPRGVAAACVALMGLGVLATVSRGSMLAMAAGLAVVGLARDRRLLAATVVAGVALLAAARFMPWTSAYVGNLIDGFLAQDRSTQMRLGEYKDALRLIARYPLLGVGFGGVRDIDLYRGVSSLYLIVAETMGLVGLGALLAFVTAAAGRWWLAWRAMPPDGLRAVVLGCLAAVVAAAVGGVFDHYFFTYPHAFALLWLILGIGMGAVRLGVGEVEGEVGVAVDPGGP